MVRWTVLSRAAAKVTSQGPALVCIYTAAVVEAGFIMSCMNLRGDPVTYPQGQYLGRSLWMEPNAECFKVVLRKYSGTEFVAQSPRPFVQSTSDGSGAEDAQSS